MTPLSIKGISQCLQDLRDVWLNYPLHPLQVSISLSIINFIALFYFQGCFSIVFHCNVISEIVLRSSQKSLPLCSVLFFVFINNEFLPL